MISDLSNSCRLNSLDIFRGGIVLLMVLVNSTWGEDSYEMLLHSEWNGITVCDFVFPAFIYILGVSCYLSLYKKGFEKSKAVLFHIIKRVLFLFLCGIIINWIFLAIRESPVNIEHLRIWGPLQRIAICNGFVALFALFSNHKYTLHLSFSLLALYSIILIWGNGYSTAPNENILTKIDIFLFGYGHIYHRSPVDPEGFLGLIPSFANTLLGFYAGSILCSKDFIKDKLISIFFVGSILFIAGFLLSYGLPINKKVWSPSFVLVTSGVASLILASLIYIIDLKKKNINNNILTAFGTNALLLYIISQILLAIFITLGLCDRWYSLIERIIDYPKWSSIICAICNTCICSLIGLFFHKHPNSM